MFAVHLLRPSPSMLMYGCEISSYLGSDQHKVHVYWNKCFRKIFNAFGLEVCYRLA